MRSESEGADSPRPLSESSEMSCDTGISEISPQGSTLNRRPKTKSFNDKHRPLTRYLPIRSTELDLRKHIETAGKIFIFSDYALNCRIHILNNEQVIVSFYISYLYKTLNYKKCNLTKLTLIR